MMFSQKIAKIGKANSVCMYEKTAGNFDVMVCRSGTAMKNLSIFGTNYTLSGVQKRFIYNNMHHLSQNLYLTKIDDNYEIVEVTDGV